MYSALTIAQYIIKHELDKDRPVTNLRLQKLLYFIQGSFYTLFNKECFYDKIEAWDYGPAIPSIHFEYSVFGSCTIFDFNKEDIEKISDYHKECINLILDICSKYSTKSLVEISKNQKPWKDAYLPIFQREITKESMKKYFCL